MNHFWKSERLDIVSELFLKEDKDNAWIYTVGAVNGSLDLLRKMIYKIEETGLGKNDKVVFLGNVIGDTEDTPKIISMLKEYKAKRPQQVIIIRGLNEQRMAASRSTFFLSDKGQGLIDAYRYRYGMGTPRKSPYVDKRQLIQDRRWLDFLPSFYQNENYFFVHASINPEMALHKQHIGALFHKNEQFMKCTRVYPKLIVSLVPQEKSEIRVNRIGIGMGKEDGTQLSCVIFNSKIKDKPVGQLIVEK